MAAQQATSKTLSFQRHEDMSSEGPESQALGLGVARLWVAAGASGGLTEQCHA